MVLPLLPDDVLDTIWDDVRRDVRRRMHSPLYFDIVQKASLRIAAKYGSLLTSISVLFFYQVVNPRACGVWVLEKKFRIDASFLKDGNHFLEGGFSTYSEFDAHLEKLYSSILSPRVVMLDGEPCLNFYPSSSP